MYSALFLTEYIDRRVRVLTEYQGLRVRVPQKWYSSTVLEYFITGNLSCVIASREIRSRSKNGYTLHNTRSLLPIAIYRFYNLPSLCKSIIAITFLKTSLSIDDVKSKRNISLDLWNDEQQKVLGSAHRFR